MTAALLNGNDLAKRLKAKMKLDVDAMKKEGLVPGLAVVIIGDNHASRSYVTMKERDCTEVGIRSFEVALPVKTPEADLLGLVDRLNADDNIHGILVQLPLPAHMNERGTPSDARSLFDLGHHASLANSILRRQRVEVQSPLSHVLGAYSAATWRKIPSRCSVRPIQDQQHRATRKE